MLTITRYAVAGDNTDPERPPLREVAEWHPLPADTADPRAVEIEEQPGKWLLMSVREPLVDMVSQHSPAVFNRFDELVDVGGKLLGSQDLYRLPVLPGYQVVDEDAYIDAWNAVCAPEQRVGAVA